MAKAKKSFSNESEELTLESLELRVAQLEEANELLLETVETMKALSNLKEELKAAQGQWLEHKDELVSDITALKSTTQKLLAQVAKGADTNHDGKVDMEEIFTFVKAKLDKAAARSRRG